MCAHPFAKEALTLHLARSEGHERYLGCNLMHHIALASSHQHLMAEAPKLAQIECWMISRFGQFEFRCAFYSFIRAHRT